MGRVRFFVGALAVMALVSTSVAAPGAMSPAQKAQAHIDLASAYFAEKNFATALEELRIALPLLAESPAQFPVLFNVARCLEEMHRDAEAITAYEAYLQSADDGPRRERATTAVAALRARTLGHLHLTCQPARTSLTVTGHGQVSCPFDGDVAVGTLVIEGRATGYKPHRSEVAVVGGGSDRADHHAPRRRAEARSGTGRQVSGELGRAVRERRAAGAGVQPDPHSRDGGGRPAHRGRRGLARIVRQRQGGCREQTEG